MQVRSDVVEFVLKYLYKYRFHFFKYRVPCYYHHHHQITVKPHYFTGLGSKKYGLELCSSELSDFAVHTYLLHGRLKHLCYVAMCDFFPDLVI